MAIGVDPCSLLRNHEPLKLAPTTTHIAGDSLLMPNMTSFFSAVALCNSITASNWPLKVAYACTLVVLPHLIKEVTSCFRIDRRRYDPFFGYQWKVATLFSLG